MNFTVVLPHKYSCTIARRPTKILEIFCENEGQRSKFQEAAAGRTAARRVAASRAIPRPRPAVETPIRAFQYIRLAVG
jgi:hypothetical protein